MKGWKTWLAAAVIGAVAVLRYFGMNELADAVFAVGVALGLIGLGHKVEKAGL